MTEFIFLLQKSFNLNHSQVEKIKRSKSEQSHLKISMQCQMLVTENTHLRKRLKELEAQLTVIKIYLLKHLIK